MLLTVLVLRTLNPAHTINLFDYGGPTVEIEISAEDTPVIVLGRIEQALRTSVDWLAWTQDCRAAKYSHENKGTDFAEIMLERAALYDVAVESAIVHLPDNREFDFVEQAATRPEITMREAQFDEDIMQDTQICTEVRCFGDFGLL